MGHCGVLVLRSNHVSEEDMLVLNNGCKGHAGEQRLNEKRINFWG
jgi:hypothetical protein